MEKRGGEVSSFLQSKVKTRENPRGDYPGRTSNYEI
jgi:hypothetical protein